MHRARARRRVGFVRFIRVIRLLRAGRRFAGRCGFRAFNGSCSRGGIARVRGGAGGRGGGVRLALPPERIGIGDVIRASETDFRLVECFDRNTNTCMLAAKCRLERLLDSALRAYFKELDGATLADLVGAPPKSGLSAAEKTHEFAIAMPPKSIARARS